MSSSVQPLASARVLERSAYEAFFGLLLIAVMLLSTLDEALAPTGRGLLLACFVLLMVVNAGAAVGVYIAAALIFSAHASLGRISWIDRPDNLMLLSVTLYLAAGRCFTHSAGRFGRTAVAVALLLVTAFTHLVTLVGVSWYWSSWFVRMYVAPLVLFVLLRRAALSPRELRALLMIVASLGIYLVAVTLLEALGWYELILPRWVADPMFNPGVGDSRIGGVAMQAEWNALEISLAFCVLLLQHKHTRGLVRLAWHGGAGLCLVAVYLTYTRAAWLGLMLAGVPLFWQRSAARGVTLRRRALFVAGALGFAGLVLFVPSEFLQGRVSEAGTMYFRLSIWAAGLDLVAHHPLFGIGFGQFNWQVGSYVQDLSWIPSSDMFKETASAHNTLLSVAAELGLIGLALYLLILAGVFRSAWASAGIAFGADGRSWVAGFTIVYLVNVQFITAHELVPNLLFFVVLGAIAGMRGSSLGSSAVRVVPVPP